MPEVQNAFARNQDSYAEGQPTDSRFNSNSKVIENSGGVAFGKPIFSGANINGATKAQTLVGAGSEQAGNTGTATITDAPVVAANAKLGRHRFIQLVAGATGEVEHIGPDGVSEGNGVVGTEFTLGGITATITTGGSPAVGDVYFVDVTGGQFLGITLRDKTRAPTNGDVIPRYAPAAYMERGSVAVRTAAAAAKDAQVYWDASADRFTDAAGAGKLKLDGWLFETGIGAAGLTPVRRI